jgi:flagellar basal-body rod protein FlgG
VIRGIYTAAAGMVTNMTRMMRTTNNLANITTPGYRSDHSPSEVFGGMMLAVHDGTSGTVRSREIGGLTTVVVADRPQLNLAQGAMNQTGRDLDVAIDGDAFFTIRKGDQTLYTRNGSFGLDGEGRLVTEDGALVLGTDGPLTLPFGTRVEISETGSIFVDNEFAGQFALARPAAGAELRKTGFTNLEVITGAMEPAGADSVVMQRYLEGANVDAANAMIEMMQTQRSYQAAQRLLTLQDQVLQRSVNELGRVG